jgi:PAS domain S-box-containing protein
LIQDFLAWNDENGGSRRLRHGANCYRRLTVSAGSHPRELRQRACHDNGRLCYDKQEMRPLKLHTKTTLLASAITLAVLMATLLLVSLRIFNLVRESEKELARLQAISVAEQISLMPIPRDQDDLERAIRQARGARTQIVAMSVTELAGNTLVKRVLSAEKGAVADLPAEMQAAISAGSNFPVVSLLQTTRVAGKDETQFQVIAPITEKGRVDGAVVLVERLDSVPTIAKYYAQTAGWLGVAAVILTIAAIYLLFRSLVYRPMNNLIEAMASVKDGSLDVQVPTSTQDEFGRLATGFNSMIGRIRELTLEREAQQETLRERVREATAESNAAAERYRLIFDSNPLPMWVYDAQTLFFLTVNEAATQNYGWTREEFLNLSILDIHPAEDAAALLDDIGRPAEEGAQLRAWRHRRKDGSLIEVEVLAHDLTFEGRKARLVIASDVTEKKRIEAGLLRSQRLESLGTLASGIAHDLNNILSPLSLSTFLLRPKISDSSGQETLDTMEEVIDRGGQLVKQILSFARGAEGELAPLDPKHLLREVSAILRETFPKSIDISSRVTAPVGAVRGNPTQLYQVLMNLCVNARDAMPRGGKLEITAGGAQLDEHSTHLLPDAKPGRYVTISVRDTGAGIPPQVIDKIFDPFFTTKGHGKGTGLGLSISLGIVRSHGGFINVYSEPDMGALFKVYLPALDAESETMAPEDPVEPPAGNGELILLVDDEEPIRRLTRNMLEAFNYRVVTAADGREACAMYREMRAEISAVLTDMMMPVMDGAATISELRRLNPELPIIASSGLAEAGKEQQARVLGARQFLSKPYTAEPLLMALRESLHDGLHGGAMAEPRPDGVARENDETDSDH